VGDVRFRDVFRETLLVSWRANAELNREVFLEECVSKSEGLKTAVKLERLLQYKMLMSGEPLDVEELLQARMVIFSLNSPLYTDTQRLAVIWFILRQILNYFLVVEAFSCVCAYVTWAALLLPSGWISLRSLV
jgi:uncharacterized membrane protein